MLACELVQVDEKLSKLNFSVASRTNYASVAHWTLQFGIRQR